MYSKFKKFFIAPKYRFLKDFTAALIILFITSFICFFIKHVNDAQIIIALIYILSIAIISRITYGYLIGFISSLLGVLLENYVCTYPFFELNFTLATYPTTFLCMFIISAIISAITCQIREQEHLKIIAEAEKMRSNLLLAVSHDLRTPLTSIIGSCSAILENYDRISQERRVQLLTDVKTDSEWLIRMVENLLSITKIQGGPAKIIKAPEIAEEIILEVVSKFKKRYSNAPIHIELPTDILVVPMDAMLIEQVLLNLLENSIRHGGNVTKIDLILRAENNFAEFKVKDNGNGISSDILPHLFDGLARTTVKNNIDSKRDMGIGLSVCNSIILAHNGNMEAYNNSDCGACFKFQIPLKEE